jgi:uncharacterized protein YjiS (DUF1127 family)
MSGTFGRNRKMHVTETHTATGTAFSLSFVRLVDALSRRLRERRAIARLQKLDDRLLNDIGLSRGEIERAVRDRKF